MATKTRHPLTRPDAFDTKFGVTFDSPDHVEGYVTTADIAALLDAFSIEPDAAVQIPYHKIVSRSGERWSLRLEPAEYSTVEGKTALVHRWVYRQETNERVAPAE